MIGVVLAGGESRRMRRDKALVEVGGLPMIEWVATALSQVSDRVVIAGRPEGWAGHDGLADPSDQAGPLAGLVAALQLGSDVLVVAVDQPWVRVDTLQALASLQGTAVPIDTGVRQVTCARYSAKIIVAARSIQEMLDHVPYLSIEEKEWRSWNEDGRSWFSVDDETALEEGLRRFGPPESGTVRELPPYPWPCSSASGTFPPPIEGGQRDPFLPPPQAGGGDHERSEW